MCYTDAADVDLMCFCAYARSRNEAEVGSAVRKSGIPREEVYITTKVGGRASILL